MNTPKIIIGNNQIKRLSGLLFLTTLFLLFIRYRLGEVHVIANLVSYITLCVFLFIYFFTGKVVSTKWSAYAIVVAVWLSITTMGLFSGGMQLPLVVVFPVLPVMALVMIGKRASLIASAITILTLLMFIILDLSGYGFNTLPLNPENVRIMRSFWLIFMVGIITVIGTYYINKIEKLTLTLQSLADTDYITGLPSRKMLNDVLRREFYRAIRLNKGLSLLFISIDDFNQLLDSAGQMMGDECLKLIGQSIKENCQRTVDYTGKFDASEYLVIMSESTHEGALNTAEKIRKTVEKQQIILDDKKNRIINVTIACITIKDLKSTDIDSILDTGDKLIRSAREEGGNRVFEKQH